MMLKNESVDNIYTTMAYYDVDNMSKDEIIEELFDICKDIYLKAKTDGVVY